MRQSFAQFLLIGALVFLFTSSGRSQFKIGNETSSLRVWELTFSYYNFEILPGDNVFPTPLSEREEMFCMGFNTTSDHTAKFAWMLDCDLQIGNLSRRYYEQYDPVVSLGIQFFYGPTMVLIRKVLSAHALAGATYLRFGGRDAYTIKQWSGGSRLLYYGGDPVYIAYSNYYNQTLDRWGSNVPAVEPESRVALALNLGVDLRLGSVFKVTLEYVPLLSKSIHNDFKIKLGWFRIFG